MCPDLSAGNHGSLLLKLGPKYDMGALCPDKTEGWQKAACGKNWCVWMKTHAQDDTHSQDSTQ